MRPYVQARTGPTKRRDGHVGSSEGSQHRHVSAGTGASAGGADGKRAVGGQDDSTAGIAVPLAVIVAGAIRGGVGGAHFGASLAATGCQ